MHPVFDVFCGFLKFAVGIPFIIISPGEILYADVGLEGGHNTFLKNLVDVGFAFV